MQAALIALSLIFSTNIPSLYFGWYLKWLWFDVFQHFLGGFFVAMLMTHYLKNHLIAREGLKNTLIIVGATVFIGVVWEFAEYIASQTLIESFYRWFDVKVYFMGDLNDTVADLLLDMLGALTFYGSHLLRRRDSHQEETGELTTTDLRP